MPKFSGPTATTRKSGGVVKTRSAQPDTHTYEGGEAHSLDSKSELFTLAVVNMVGENTYYEDANKRDSRFVELIHTVTKEDPVWVARFIPYLRNEMNMRSATVVMACEFAKAFLDAKMFATIEGDGFTVRKVINFACVRADEPAEILGYWLATYGRKIPQPVKRGIADATIRLYTERNSIKYDGQSRGIRMADVIELVHPKPKNVEQSALFNYLISKRHNREGLTVPPLLKILKVDEELQNMAIDKRRDLVVAAATSGTAEKNMAALTLSEASMTWERLAGWLQGPMDKDAWSAIIPEMGYMALLRNLRNFEEAKIPSHIAKRIAEKLANPEEVARSRQFPFRFWSAYREVPTARYLPAIEEAVQHSCKNVPKLDGKTLVLVDVSGSMSAAVSQRSTVARWEIGAVFGGAMFFGQDGAAELVPFATSSTKMQLSMATSIMKVVEGVAKIVQSGRLDHGTNIWSSVRQHYNGHKRVVIFTDMQAHDSYRGSQRYIDYEDRRGTVTGSDLDQIPYIYAFDLGGYGKTGMRAGDNGRYQLAGFSDKIFSMMAMLEAKNEGWPF